MKQRVHFEWIEGMNYDKVWEYQKQLHQRMIQYKVDMRNNSENTAVLPPDHHLIFCEHLPVYTLGKSGSKDNLLLPKQDLNTKSIEYFDINRGGDITYHGPGQITGYLIFDLERFYTDVHRYVRNIEESIILCLREYGLEGMRLEGFTGVWLAPRFDGDTYRKICAIGVHLSRWVSMHGFAFNVNTDLSYYNHIIPCGIQETTKSVTSLAKELNIETLDLKEVGHQLLKAIQSVFDIEPSPTNYV